MTEIMLLIPLAVGCKLMTSTEFLMTSHLKLVEIGEVTLGTDMGEEVRCVAESWLFGTDGAMEQCRCHCDRLQGAKSGGSHQ